MSLFLLSMWHDSIMIRIKLSVVFELGFVTLRKDVNRSCSCNKHMVHVDLMILLFEFPVYCVLMANGYIFTKTKNFPWYTSLFARISIYRKLFLSHISFGMYYGTWAEHFFWLFSPFTNIRLFAQKQNFNKRQKVQKQLCYTQ